MKYLQDIIIGVLLLFGLVSGFISGGIKKGVRLAVTLGAVFGIYFGFKDIIVDFLRYDLLNLVTQGKGFALTVNNDLTIQIMNFEDLFIVLQNADENLTALQLKQTCEVLFTVITFLVILLVVELVSFPVSFILYHLVFKFVFMAAGKKPRMLGRCLGGVFGVIEVGIFTYFYMVSFGQFTCLFQEFQSIYEAIPAGSVPQLDSFMNVFKQINDGVNYNNSFILGGVINALNSAGVDPFAFVSITTEAGDKITLPKAIQGIHDAAFDSIVKFIEGAFNSGGNGGAPAPEGAEVAQLYKFSFN